MPQADDIPHNESVVVVNEDDEWDEMVQGWRPPGSFRGSRDWDIGIHDQEGAIEFTITSELALEIGRAILGYFFVEDVDSDYSFDVNINESTFTITRDSLYLDSDGANAIVVLNKDDGQILGVYVNGTTDSININITQELALKIGDIILLYVFSENALYDTVFFVTELPRDNCFLVTRVQRYPVVLGTFPSVAIDSLDGRIIKVYWG